MPGILLPLVTHLQGNLLVLIVGYFLCTAAILFQGLQIGAVYYFSLYLGKSNLNISSLV